MSLPKSLSEITSMLSGRGIPHAPDAVVILGSGLGGFAGEIETTHAIPYPEIPHFPQSSVDGHDGTLLSGSVEGRAVIAFSGRFHHYEGYTFEQTVLPVHLAKALNARKLLISNAAGAINTSFSVGDLMVIEDVIRQNMAIAPRGHGRYAYNHAPLVDRVHELAKELGIVLRQGTYIYAKGPNYETKAEIRSFRTMGADAVGMSTAPELMEAARLKIPTVAVSMISNMAAGVTGGKLSHEEVSEAATLRKDDFARLFKTLIKNL